MILLMYVIYDSVARLASFPFTAPNDKVALRNFFDAVKSSPVPWDYTLRRVGTFDTETGVVWSEGDGFEDVSVVDLSGGETEFASTLKEYQLFKPTEVIDRQERVFLDLSARLDSLKKQVDNIQVLEQSRFRFFRSKS